MVAYFGVYVICRVSAYVQRVVEAWWAVEARRHTSWHPTEFGEDEMQRQVHQSFSQVLGAHPSIQCLLLVAPSHPLSLLAS